MWGKVREGMFSQPCNVSGAAYIIHEPRNTTGSHFNDAIIHKQLHKDSGENKNDHGFRKTIKLTCDEFNIKMRRTQGLHKCQSD